MWGFPQSWSHSWPILTHSYLCWLRKSPEVTNWWGYSPLPPLFYIFLLRLKMNWANEEWQTKVLEMLQPIILLLLLKHLFFSNSRRGGAEASSMYIKGRAAFRMLLQAQEACMKTHWMSLGHSNYKPKVFLMIKWEREWIICFPKIPGGKVPRI